MCILPAAPNGGGKSVSIRVPKLAIWQVQLLQPQPFFVVQLNTMENSPLYIALVFGLTTLLTIFIFFKAASQSRKVLLIIISWLLLQTVISGTGFYEQTQTMPPRFILTILPPLLFIAGLFITPAGKHFIDSLQLKTLTLLHIIRIPVEIVLVWLFLQKSIPGLMTFEGRNFDILSGISAPVIYYFAFVSKKLSWNGLLLWNFLCLALLLNIVVIAILSGPFVFQQFAFEQPDVALLYFPFVWLPSCVVPLVLLSHLASIRQLLKRKSSHIPVVSYQK